jgi:hypothetical protein
LSSSSPTFAGLTVNGDLHVNVGNVHGITVNCTSGNSPYLRLCTSSSYHNYAIATIYNGDFLEFLVGASGTAPLTSIASLDPSGNLIVSGTVTGSLGVVSDYLSGAYGVTWGSLPSFPTATNGMYIILWNTNTSTGRIYCYAGGAWHYSALI